MNEREASTAGGGQRRCFALPENRELLQGALVCLRDGATGDLVAAKQCGVDGWQLTVLPRLTEQSSGSLPAEALFSISRRGGHIAFQCLVAEGRMIHANEHFDGLHGLFHGFGSREAWECNGSDGRMVNVHHRFKELGLTIQHVTATPTAQLVALEQQCELEVQQLRKQPERQWEERWLEGSTHDLIKAGQRSAAQERREADALGMKLEAVNKMALRWQEAAARAGDALREAEETIAALRRGGGGSGGAAAELERAKAEHALQLERMQKAHTAELQAASQKVATAVDLDAAMRAEALAAKDGEHAAAVAYLLEERSRLHTALRCIKEMLAEQPSDSAASAETLEVAIGVPAPSPAPDSALRTTLQGQTSLPATATSVESARVGGRTPGGATAASFSPAPAEHAVFDAAVRDRIDVMYELINPFRPNSALGAKASSLRSEPCRVDYIHFANGGEGGDTFVSPGATLSPGSAAAAGLQSARSGHSIDSVHRRCIGDAGDDGSCWLVDYNGPRPDAITEAAMARILDAPLPPLPEEGGSALLGRMNHHASSAVGSPPARNLRRRAPAVTSAPASASKTERSLPADGLADWPVGSMSLPGSRATSPALQEEAGDSCEPSLAPLPVTAAVEALDCASPTAANFVAQYIADGVAARASLSALPSGNQRQGGRPGGKGSNVLRRSAPAAPAPRKRSTFLVRPLVSDKDVYPWGNGQAY